MQHTTGKPSGHLWRKVYPHLIAIVIFIILGFAYCSPVLQGEVLQQSDMVQVEGMSKEAKDYYAQTGQHPLWTNSMFCGMPSYLIFTGPTANLLQYGNLVFTLNLPSPVNMLFLAMLGMYVLLTVLGFDYIICLIGAVAFGFSSYNVIIIGAGHITKMMSMAYMPLVLAGMWLLYRGKWIIGGVVTALMAAMMVYNNHLQIMYYAAILGACMVVGFLIIRLRQHQFRQFLIATLILILAAILALLPAADNLLITREYARYSIRDSQSELTLAKKNEEVGKGGLNIDYAFQWSLGKLETFSILIPNVYGGPVTPTQVEDSHVYQTLNQQGIAGQQAGNVAAQILQYAYWGPQPFTSPVYFGAIICFLFLLGCFLIKSPHKWWLIAATAIGIILSWGKHLAFINDFLFYHLPLYNKFRSPSMAMVIPQLTFVWMAAWTLQELIHSKWKKADLLRVWKYTAIIMGVLLLIVGSGMLVNYNSPNDDQLMQAIGNSQLGQTIVNALRDDRASLLHHDALRSFIWIAIIAVLIWLWIQHKIKPHLFFIIAGLSILIDLWAVDKRYLNDQNFTDELSLQQIFQPSPAIQHIQQDPDPYFRVLNLSVGLNNIFNDALTSYFVKSIGGYSPAKLWRYQDLIDYQLMPAITRLYSILQTATQSDSTILNAFSQSPVLNMLNTRYFILNPQATPVKNSHALGNAWFISQVQWAANADSEMLSLNNFDPATTVIIDRRYQHQLPAAQFETDSSAHIRLTSYGLNELHYASQNNHNGFAVFSDIYYPAGWKAYVDGKEMPIVRVNYLLRGLYIPAGTHEIVFRFHPNTYFLGQRISFWASLFLILIVVAAVVWEWKKSSRNARQS
ncbi:membrane protein YfhO [Thermoflavifilum aggregans]|uniref:Membrane protein YfhO n=1 Tax=Thermoflavifilum aggregans TaxID=454188 RepID=A0A2M9CUN8_9BACT|nr:YfhO family protein [Thermoflavifilum aggregans]PJJ75627.1 membrane protein YfhO [Thermoflavifilum aggregans]